MTEIKGKIAPYAISTQGGQKIGIVGLTTYELLIKSSPNGTVPRTGNPAATTEAGKLAEVAIYVQAAVDALTAQGVNKIIMVDQLDTIERNKALVPLVSGIDVMVAGGGHERMGDATDVAVGFNGHTADFIADAFPIVATAKDGKKTLIVTTDTEYTYLGRLVVDFDANGEIIVSNLDPVINGAYASTEATLQKAYNSTQTADQIVASSSIGAQVDAITDAIAAVIASKDGAIWGYTSVYLEGDRAFGRAQEVNFGDISADANAAVAQRALGAGIIVGSLKNGGGLRASIGSIDENGNKIAPIANPLASKPAGAISTLDIENALRFDNKLMVFDTTAAGLKAIFEFSAGLPAGNGGYMQIGGLRVSFDPTKASGSRVQNISAIDLNGKVIARIIENGQVSANALATISMVSLNFTANGGDGYPIKANATNFRYLLTDGTLSAAISSSLDFTAAANLPANTLGEQDAFKQYLQAFHATPNKAYAVADTPATQDQRIQNLTVKTTDTVMTGGTTTGTVNAEALFGSAGDDSMLGLGGNDTMNAGIGQDTLDGGAGADVLGGGDGNDTYLVDAQADLIFEGANGGTDSVIASASFYLYANLEALTLAAGAGDLFGVGNDLANTMTGNAGANLLLGGAGNDSLMGMEGNDALFGQDGADSLAGGAGIDALLGGIGADTLDGGTEADLLDGGEGDDSLTGGAGFFTDILLGGDGNDTLDGASGAGDYDILTGGAGNDTYRVDSATDQVNESAGGGTDTVLATLASGGYTLSAEVENLTLLGTTYFGVGNALGNAILGNASANWLMGGAGNDTITGGAGNDVLFGEAGADTFVFARGSGGDAVIDFATGADKVDLRGFGFIGFAHLLNSVSEVNGTAVLDLGLGDFVVFNGVAKSSFGAADFILA